MSSSAKMEYPPPIAPFIAIGMEMRVKANATRPKHSLQVKPMAMTDAAGNLVILGVGILKSGAGFVTKLPT
jgi:hypothetical protein